MFIANGVEYSYCAFIRLPDGTEDQLYTNSYDRACCHEAKGEGAGFDSGIRETAPIPSLAVELFAAGIEPF